MRLHPSLLLPFTCLPLLAQDPPGVYDPLAGMDPDGRIERPELPADLPNPERWRYTPQGRIKPGSVLERFLVSSFVSPIFFRNADVGFGGGLALTDVDFRNQNYREFANVVLTYSDEGQQAYRINWSRWLHYRRLEGGGVVREERGRLFGRLGYEKTLTRRYFGRGSRSPGQDETSYTEELSGLGFGMRDTLGEAGSDWLWRVDGHLEHRGLSRGRVEGLPSTGERFAEDFQSGDGVTQFWLLSNFGWDTRDSLHQAYEGQRIGVTLNSSLGSGGRHGGIIGLDAQQVFPLPPLLHRGARGREENPPTDCIAIGGFVQDTFGDLPFYSLPTLGGGSTLRSFIENRFTDRAAAHAAIEYRFSLVPRGYAFTDTVRIERVNLALFAEVGTVAAGVEELDAARWHHSYGVGLRIGFSREASFRIDVGYGDEGSNFTIAFGNPF